MGKDLVLYQSKYGASRSYAEWLGAAWGCPACALQDCKGGLGAYQRIVLVGGLYAGIMHVKQWAYGTSTIFALPVYLGEDNSFLHICIAVAIAMASAFILSYITHKDPVEELAGQEK